MNIRLGYISDYRPQGYGFLADPSASPRVDRRAFFHVKAIKRKYPEFARMIESGSWADNMRWYSTEPSRRGRGEDVADTWLTAKEVPNDSMSYAVGLVRERWAQMERKRCSRLEAFTKS